MPEVHLSKKQSYEPQVSDISESEDDDTANLSEKVISKSAPSISTSIMDVFNDTRKRHCDYKNNNNNNNNNVYSD